jgi:acetylornithine deacetylase/succinyl-diaminopimelate desuccinylase-like protein
MRSFNLAHKNVLVGFSEQYGTYLAGPGIAEKGFLNVQVEVKAPGGHSSVPPAHTVCLRMKIATFGAHTPI